MISTLFPEALRALGANPLRTLLAMLGMIIGVAAVVLMLAIGEGSRLRVAETIATLGSDILNVQSGAPVLAGLRTAIGSAPTLTQADAEAIGRLDSVQAVAPAQYNTAQLQYGGANWQTAVFGSTPAFVEVRNWEMASGELFDAGDVRTAAQKVVLGATVVANLFGDEAPEGKVLRIKGQPYEVIGVFRAKGNNLEGRDQDDLVLVPLSASQGKLFGNPFPGTVRTITLKARPEAGKAVAEREVTALLRQRHRLQEEADNDFFVRDLTAQAESAAEAARAMSVLLGSIASVSLLVGGVGIMNIMLVTVTERTREIGVRMAIGARRRDILAQFLLEAVLICLTGGLLGAALGVTGAWIAARYFDTAVVVDLLTALVAFLFAAGVGLFFGYYPARRAAWMQPVDALRA
jgi:putative ABC transport system permease protein